MSGFSIPESDVAVVALAEVESQELALTQQFFAVHQLRRPDPIAHITNLHGCWQVYMQLEGERYYWVSVVAHADGELHAVAGNASAHSKLYLSVMSDSLSPHQVTSRLGLSPYESHRLGEMRAPGAGYENHRWYFRPEVPACLNFEAKLAALLATLIPRRHQLEEVQAEASTYIGVAQYEYKDWAGGWHLDRSALQSLAALNLELDIDLYLGGPDLPD